MHRKFNIGGCFQRIQSQWLSRVAATRSSFPNLVKANAAIIAKQWELKGLLDAQQQLSQTLPVPAYQQFGSIYFFRNFVYLRASFMLAQEGSCGPCYDLLRTIYESISRMYLFALDNPSADLLYKQVQQTAAPADIKLLKKRNYYDYAYCSKQLWVANRQSFDQLFSHLCKYAHPSIQSANLDWIYSSAMVRDCLQLILSMSIGNIQAMMETFHQYISGQFRKVCRSGIKDAVTVLQTYPAFIPDAAALKPRFAMTATGLDFGGKRFI